MKKLIKHISSYILQIIILNIKKKLKKYEDIRIIKENDISKVLSEAKLVVSNDGMPIYLSHVLGIENLNIVSNKPSQVPNNFCNKILYVK